MSAGRRILRRFEPKDGVPRPWMAPLDAPRWLGAAQAAAMRPGDAVLGLEFAGRAWTLPWWIMKNHHVANLVLEGRPVMVTLCEICSSAAAMDPVIDGRAHRFRLAGLYNGTIMPSDEETGSLWTGFTGRSIRGPLRGHRLRRLPLWQSTWAEWLERHPRALVADGRGEPRGGHGEGQTPGSPVVGPGMRALLSRIDRRRPHHELVLGVSARGRNRCYPLATLEAQGAVLNDALGGEPLAIFSRPGTWMAIAYSRKLDGTSLDFRADADGIFDEQTGSRWTLEGVASAGPLAGRRLRYVDSGIEEFFIWGAFAPRAGIHRHTRRRAPRVWSADRVPEAVHKAISTWRGERQDVLFAGCGDGMIAAWAAERGLDVLGVDADEDLIARARRSFRGAVRLEFAAADLSRPHAFARRFDAVIDHGYFAGLAEPARAAYLSNLRAATRPGAILLLLMPCARRNLKRLAARVERALQPHFTMMGVGRRGSTATFRARRAGKESNRVQGALR